MANVLDVAKYIVDKYGEIGTWKLQKLVYYCQAWSLVWDERPLFESRIEAWANGPVSTDLFDRHKGMYSITSDSPELMDANSDVLTNSEKETVDSVLDYYGDRPGHWLRELTHLEEPWNQAREGVPVMESCNNEITYSMMRLYYGAL